MKKGGKKIKVQKWYNRKREKGMKDEVLISCRVIIFKSKKFKCRSTCKKTKTGKILYIFTCDIWGNLSIFLVYHTCVDSKWFCNVETCRWINNVEKYSFIYDMKFIILLFS
jgi:hypothetical protein